MIGDKGDSIADDIGPLGSLAGDEVRATTISRYRL